MAKKKTARSTARKKTTGKKTTGKRTRLKNRAGSFYSKRKTTGQFDELDERGRSQAADRPRKARKKVKSGYGDQGDRARKKR